MEKYEEHVCEKISENPEKRNLEELRVKKLGCWCFPEKCHGDVLKKLVEEKNSKAKINDLRKSMSFEFIFS